MKIALVLLVATAILIAWRRAAHSQPGSAAGQKLAHMVFFTLNDNTPAAKQKLVDACKKYLSKHPGEVYFSAGARAEALDRPVNDREFDVALHIVFADKSAHDKYQDAPRHNEFIAENKDNWKKVRVFDSLVD